MIFTSSATQRGELSPLYCVICFVVFWIGAILKVEIYVHFDVFLCYLFVSMEVTEETMIK